MHNPRLMFFDEPTSGLDPMNAHIIKEIILEQKKANKTIFLTTHNMTVAEQLCDRVAFIVEGKIVVIGSPKELMIEHGKRIVDVEYQKNGSIHKQSFDLQNLGENIEFYGHSKDCRSKNHTQLRSHPGGYFHQTNREELSMRLLHAVLADIRFQIKHGFYLVYAIITAMYLIILSFLPENILSIALPLIVFLIHQY
jgi:ABC-type multidrug transport system ATPase subunit